MPLYTLQLTDFAWLVLLIIIIIYMIYDLYSRRPKRSITYTRETLVCTKCGLNVERDFEPGDFIGLVKGKCPSCGGNLKIKAIYSIEKTKK